MKKGRTSCYKEKIEGLNVSQLFWSNVEESFDPDWTFVPNPSFEKKIMDIVSKLDFREYDYMFYTASYWCGILTLAPFYDLGSGEATILNNIKNHHLRFVKKDEELFLEFHNPTKSPLYRFFNKYKEDGYGGNVTYSVQGLIRRIGDYLEKEFQELDAFGTWEPYAETPEETEAEIFA